MVSLFTLPQKAKVLDPCFGKGVFLDALDRDARYIMEGIEIDRNNYNFYLHRVPRQCTLLNGDFFSTDSRRRFDGIIMNPPYIRQEDIDNLKEYGISKERLREKVGAAVDSKANLYMYFVLYALKLLRDQGELIAIFPNSWEKSKSGEAFKRALDSTCTIEQHISVSGKPFIGSPIVDVSILKFKKTDREETTLYKEK